MPGKGAEIGIVAVAVSFLMSLIVMAHFVANGNARPEEAGFTWFDLGGFSLQVSMFVDGLTAVMFCVVTFVSLCVQIYSTAYMHEDRRYTWYFAAPTLLTASLLDLDWGKGLVQHVLGWIR